jgi:hypothetical protein
LGFVVASGDFCPVTGLTEEFLCGLEEIDVKSDEFIELLKLDVGGLGCVAVVSDEAADDGAVFLLDVGIVVLLVGSATGEGNRFTSTEFQQGVVDEFGPVVGIPAQEGKRESLTHMADTSENAVSTLSPNGLELHPGRANVHCAQRGQIEARRRVAAMSDEIALEKSRSGVVPVGEGSNGDLALEQGSGSRRTVGSGRIELTSSSQESVEGRRTDLPQEFGHPRSDGDLLAAHEPLEQLGDEGLKSLGADLSRRLPDDGGGFCNGRSIESGSPRAAPAIVGGWGLTVQEPDSGLSMVAGHGHNLIEDTGLLGAGRLRISGSLGLGILPNTHSRHGYLPVSLGNRSFEVRVSPR